MHLSLWSVSKNPQSRTENYRKEHSVVPASCATRKRFRRPLSSLQVL
nr:MAG TPA: hypothetical protein [Caudoviricetes sp.]